MNREQKLKLAREKLKKYQQKKEQEDKVDETLKAPSPILTRPISKSPVKSPVLQVEKQQTTDSIAQVLQPLVDSVPKVEPEETDEHEIVDYPSRPVTVDTQEITQVISPSEQVTNNDTNSSWYQSWVTKLSGETDLVALVEKLTREKQELEDAYNYVMSQQEEMNQWYLQFEEHRLALEQREAEYQQAMERHAQEMAFSSTQTFIPRQESFSMTEANSVYPQSTQTFIQQKEECSNTEPSASYNQAEHKELLDIHKAIQQERELVELEKKLLKEREETLAQQNILQSSLEKESEQLTLLKENIDNETAQLNQLKLEWNDKMSELNSRTSQVQAWEQSLQQQRYQMEADRQQVEQHQASLSEQENMLQLKWVEIEQEHQKLEAVKLNCSKEAELLALERRQFESDKLTHVPNTVEKTRMEQRIAELEHQNQQLLSHVSKLMDCVDSKMIDDRLQEIQKENSQFLFILNSIPHIESQLAQLTSLVQQSHHPTKTTSIEKTHGEVKKDRLTERLKDRMTQGDQVRELIRQKIAKKVPSQ